jgi:DNA invertase Pin-like site-specific DNA recombinase
MDSVMAPTAPEVDAHGVCPVPDAWRRGPAAGASTGTGAEPTKITLHHRERRAYVYVRQSSPKQVQQHRESQRNQHALVQRAIGLGWAPRQVHVIDADLGQSGQDPNRRGFQELVAEVSLGRVGIVLAYEASRLARSNADWYALLDLATVVGVLIADADGVYDPRSYNDRLLLGLRGMFSEAELHLLQLRLVAGRRRQIERGTYQQQLPTGLVRLADGRVVQDPDQEVQRMLALVFERFARLGSCQKLLRSLRDDGLLLPRWQTCGARRGELVWKRPSDAALYDILKNPAYAGAFVYGRHGRHPDWRPGQPERLAHRPMAEWVVHRDAYPAYIPWEQFVATQDRLADNASRFATGSRGAPRRGPALLVGLLVCGHCGRRLRVNYVSHSHVQYFCAALNRAYGAPTCLHVAAAPIEAAVVAAFFEAIAPAELSLLDDVLAAQRADAARVAQQYADRVARAEYEAHLARKGYMAVDPENRLVAAELERRWESALQALAAAREAAERVAQPPAAPTLTPELRAQLQDVGRHLPTLWTSGRLRPEHKKELLRSLVRRVIVARPVASTVEVKIVWVSGAMSPLTLHPSVHRAVDVGDYARVVERVLALAREGHPDGEIARRLTAEGFRSARRANVPPDWVGKIRRAHRQPSLADQFRWLDQIDRQWTVRGLTRLLQVKRSWVYHHIRAGHIPTTRHPATGHHLIPNAPTLLAQLQARCAVAVPHPPG